MDAYPGPGQTVRGEHGVTRVHKYLIRRAAFGVLTIFGVSIIIFVVMRLLPGDLLAVMYGEGATKLTAADRAKIMQELHLSDPLYQQYCALDERPGERQARFVVLPRG